MTDQDFVVDLAPILEDQSSPEENRLILLKDIKITHHSDSIDESELPILTLSISNDAGNTILHTTLSEVSPSIWQPEGHTSVQWSTSESVFIKLHLLSASQGVGMPSPLGDIFMFNGDSELLSKAKEGKKFSSLFSALSPDNHADNSNEFECFLSSETKPSKDNLEAKAETHGNEIRAAILNEVGHKFHHRAVDTQDLKRAILAYRPAVKLATETPLRHKYLLDLVLASLMFSESTSQSPVDDIDQKISLIQTAQHRMADIDWDRLALELHGVKQPTEDLEELNDLISRAKRFVSGHDRMSAVKNTLTLQFQLHHLGYCLQRRFLHTGDQADWEDAIPYIKRAMSLYEESHEGKQRPDMMANLATSLIYRFKHTRLLSDLDEAVSTLRQSASLTPSSDQSRQRILNNLGEMLWCRFEITGSLKDVEDAIRTQTSGLAASASRDLT